MVLLLSQTILIQMIFPGDYAALSSVPMNAWVQRCEANTS